MKSEEERTSMNSNDEEIKFRYSRVNDLILYPLVTEQRIQELKDFTTKPGDVFIVSYPKSGTHWVVAIVKQIANPAMPEGKNEELIPGAKSIPYFELNDSAQLAAYPSPRYMSTHLPYALMPDNRQHNLKYIFIARNPRDVAVSYFHFLRAMAMFDWDGTWDEFFEYFIKGNVPFGSYFDHLLGWLKYQKENLLFIKYENLKKEPQGYIKAIANFIGHQISQEEIERVAEKTSFSYMKANPKTNMDLHGAKLYKKESAFSSMRRGVVGDWQNYFSDEQLDKITKLYDSRMEGTGLDFEFTE